MKNNLIEKICCKYPNLFDNNHCSLSCGDVWFQLLDIVCYKIDWHNKHQASAMIYFPEKFNTPYQQAKILEVQEWFGQLKIYVSGGDYYVQGVIDLAEEMSGFLIKFMETKDLLTIKMTL